MNITMPTVADLKALLDKAESMLQGEPARAIGYGAAVVIVGVSLVSNALGFTRIPAVDFPTAVTLAGAAVVTLVTVIERIRSLVTPVAKPNL